MNKIKTFTILINLVVFINAYGQDCTWGGSWSGTCNGSGGVPSSADNAIINAPLTLTDNLECQNLEVNAEVNFAVKDKKISVNGTYIEVATGGSIVADPGINGCHIEIATGAGNVDIGGGAGATDDSLVINDRIYLKCTNATLRTDQGTPDPLVTGLVIAPGGWIDGESLDNISGEVEVRQRGNTATTAWNMWGTPVYDAMSPYSYTLTKLISAANMNAGGAYYFNFGGTGSSSWIQICSGCGDPSQNIGSIIPGRGYLFMGDSEGSNEPSSCCPDLKYFKGTLYSDATTQIATAAGITEGFGLFANPYASLYNFKEFYTQNSAKLATGTAYFWTDDATTGSGYSSADYAACNSSGDCTQQNASTVSAYLLPCQGFMVELSAGGAFNLDRDHLSNLGDSVGKFPRNNPIEDRQKVWLNVVDSNGYTNETLLTFSDSATMGFDKALDGKKIIVAGNLGIYSFIQNERYIIQSMPKLTSSQIIPFGIITNASGDFALKLRGTENLPAGTTLQLEDLDNNIMHNLDSSDYVVSLAQDTFDNRFLLHVGLLATDLEETVKNDYITAYVKRNQLYIDGLRNMGVIHSLEIFDLSGRKVESRQYNAEMSTLEIKTQYKGMHIIRLRSEKGVTIKKIFM